MDRIQGNVCTKMSYSVIINLDYPAKIITYSSSNPSILIVMSKGSTTFIIQLHRYTQTTLESKGTVTRGQFSAIFERLDILD